MTRPGWVLWSLAFAGNALALTLLLWVIDIAPAQPGSQHALDDASGGWHLLIAGLVAGLVGFGALLWKGRRDASAVAPFRPVITLAGCLLAISLWFILAMSGVS